MEQLHSDVHTRLIPRLKWQYGNEATTLSIINVIVVITLYVHYYKHNPNMCHCD